MHFSADENSQLLRLSDVQGIGPNKLRGLIAHFRTPSKVFSASQKSLVEAGKVDTKTAKKIKQHDGHAFVEHQITQLRKCDTRMVTFWDEVYPKPLKQIYDPPAILFVKGDLKPQDRFSVSIVGTRKPSNYGKRATEKLASELAGMGLTIVSGLAYGTDTLAHRFALQSGSRTLAVLGSGADVIYPATNQRLAEKIVDSGALISEFPMGTQPDWKNFPRRNRIVGGLSLGTVVIEAAERSGALITASMAIEQNREVFAVPGNIDSPNSVGTNNLIKEGAKLVTSVADIIEELAARLETYLKKPTAVADLELNGDETTLLEQLNHEQKHVDAIAASLNWNTSRVLALLLSLELKNLVKQHPGKLFVRI